MKTSRKISLVIIIALALLACLILLVSQRDDPYADVPIVADTSGGPSFDVRVAVPRMGRPLGGILPDALVRKLDGTPSELRFDHTSPGAQIVNVGHDRVELKADDWDLLVETDSEGRITSATRLVFPVSLGGRHLRLSCRTANPGSGFLKTTTRAAADQLDGRFLVKLGNCENADSGKTSVWPPAPLTVRGSFAGLPRGGR